MAETVKAGSEGQVVWRAIIQVSPPKELEIPDNVQVTINGNGPMTYAEARDYDWEAEGQLPLNSVNTNECR